MYLPKLFQVRQIFERSSLGDVRAAVRNEIAGLRLEPSVKAGQSAAVAVGSRGIDNIAALVAATVASLKSLGLVPFVVPAMGSHGDAKAEGQKSVLADLGVTEDSAGAPIVSSMDTVSLGQLESGAEVQLAKDACRADHLVIINRVKPHTAFRSEVESGLCKMLTVGCGKHKGALNMHKFGLADTIVPAARLILEKQSVLFGLAVVENSLDQTHIVRAAGPDKIVETDAELLKKASELMPRIPINDLDLLIIDEMGKNISGAGIDPNVVGKWRREGGPRVPDYRNLVVLDLTPQSHGNAVGIGIADLISKKLADKVDLSATYTNTLTSGVWASARLPMSLDTDSAAIEAALSRIPRIEKIRLARIKNTLQLGAFQVSQALLPELQANQNLEIDPSPVELEFNGNGSLLPLA